MKRKEFIRNTGTLSAALISGMVVTSCSLFMDEEMELCPESEVEKGSYKEFLFNRKKIQLRRVDSKLEVLSLTCSHRSCTVAYKEDENVFVCPCHDGMYNFEGEVIDGPPPAPLTRFAFEVRDGVVWVLNEKLK